MKNLPNDIQAAIGNLDKAFHDYKLANEMTIVPVLLQTYEAKIIDAKRQLINVLTSEII